MKNVNFDSLNELLKGAQTLSDAVSSTLGPKGRTVIIESNPLTVTKDGVTVASHITLPDPTQNLAVSIIKQAASKTALTAGDGTTTATLLSYALLKELSPLLPLHSPIEIKKKLDLFVSKAIAHLNDISTPTTLDDIYKIAFVASNNDPAIASLIQTAYTQISLSGMIVLEESKSNSSYLKIAEGATFTRGYISRYFVNNSSTSECILENPYVLITDSKLSSISELLPILNEVAQAKGSLLVVAEEVEGQVLHSLAINSLSKVLPACAIKAPSFGDSRADLLTDLAILTSTTVFSLSKGDRFEDIKLSQLGRAHKTISRKDETVIVSTPDPSRIKDRISEIDLLLQDSEAPYITNLLLERKARLSSKIAQIFVGAPTEAELREKKDRLDDALRATRSSTVQGYLSGGGTSFINLKDLTDNTLIDQAISRALEYPLRKIASNAAFSPDLAVDRVYAYEEGFNALTSTFTDLNKEGIIDPTFVITEALTNAASAASMILLSSCTITNIDRTPQYSPGTLDDFASN
jgi:chaperonin GroEL